jgi:hypothetical protein
MRTLAYWKRRKIDLTNCIANTPRDSEYWAELWRAYRYATRSVEKIERRVLVKHTINR